VRGFVSEGLISGSAAVLVLLLNASSEHRADAAEKRLGTSNAVCFSLSDDGTSFVFVTFSFFSPI
jgi:hypothetical protein